MGGGSMLRTMGRTVSGVGVKDVLSATAGVRPDKSALVDSVRLSASSPPLLASSGVSTGGRDESFSGGTEHLVFGPVPSKEEAEEAVSVLQRIFPVSFSQFIEDGLSSLEKDASDKMPSSTKMIHQVSSTELELEWTEPTAQQHNSEASQLQGQNKVIDAFRLLQLNPSVQMHSKKRCRLERKRLNDLVFVRFNQILRKIFLIGQEKGDAYDPFSLKELMAPVSGWLVDSPDTDIADEVVMAIP